MKFTKEWIEKCRQKIGFGWSSTGQSTISAIAKLALDEIERLQAERDQVCEWEGIRYSPPGLTAYYVYYSPHNASLWITTNQIEYFTFCPNCGKRIKYVEES